MRTKASVGFAQPRSLCGVFRVAEAYFGANCRNSCLGRMPSLLLVQSKSWVLFLLELLGPRLQCLADLSTGF